MARSATPSTRTGLIGPPWLRNTARLTNDCRQIPCTTAANKKDLVRLARGLSPYTRALVPWFRAFCRADRWTGPSRSGRILALHAPQVGVNTSLGKQTLVGPVLHDLQVPQHEDDVCVPDRPQMMGDDH